MLIQQVDPIGLEALQRRVGHLANVRRPAVESCLLAAHGDVCGISCEKMTPMRPVPLLSIVMLSVAALAAQTAQQAGTITGRLRSPAGTPAIAIRVAAVEAPPPTARREDGQQY